MADLSMFKGRMALSPKEVCDLLGVSRTTFDRLRRENRIHAVKTGKRVFVPIGDVEELLSLDRRALRKT